jgi:hypothetical protein
METQFYILLSLKTRDGFENYGQFFFGDDREAAYALFDSLQGNDTITGTAMLHIDLMETVSELPAVIKTKCCTLDELGYNVKAVAREIFRQKNLKAYEE